MLFPQKQIDSYQASLEGKVLLFALIVVALCVFMGVISVAQGTGATIYHHSAAWQLST
jgi:cell division protein FtsL